METIYDTAFEYAGGFDFLGREAEALPHYLRILDEGFERLPAEDQPRLFIQLGSTLRNLGRFEESRKILEEGLSRFPGAGALRLFLSLTQYSAGRPDDALRTAIEACLLSAADSSLVDYARPLRAYASDLPILPLIE